jgi:hypothetical protein
MPKLSEIFYIQVGSGEEVNQPVKSREDELPDSSLIDIGVNKIRPRSCCLWLVGGGFGGRGHNLEILAADRGSNPKAGGRGLRN